MKGETGLTAVGSWKFGQLKAALFVDIFIQKTFLLLCGEKMLFLPKKMQWLKSLGVYVAYDSISHCKFLFRWQLLIDRFQ